MNNLMLKSFSEQLGLIYDGDPWYGPSIRTVFESVSKDHLFESPDKTTHSIAELIAHMIAWRKFVVDKLREQPIPPPQQEQTFNWRLLAKKKKNVLEVLHHTFETSQQELLQQMNGKDDGILPTKVPGKPYSFHYLLQGVIHHDLYHLGQIVYIQRILTNNNHDLPAGSLLRYSYRIFPFENLALQK